MIEITLPGLPASPNVTKTWHWAKRAKESKRWRIISAYAASKFRPKKPFEKVALTFVRCSSRPMDIDNGVASLKPIIDGLKDAGLILDDNPQVVTSVRFGWEKAPPKLGYIKIIVEILT